jgi:hypothetical protein
MRKGRDETAAILPLVDFRGVGDRSGEPGSATGRATVAGALAALRNAPHDRSAFVDAHKMIVAAIPDVVNIPTPGTNSHDYKPVARRYQENKSR